MEGSTARLVLIQEGGPEQVYELSKSSISIGRAMTNDIILSDTRVSRSHARLDYTPGGWTVSDSGSSNGTRLNGIRVERSALKPGDMINLGNTQARFETAEIFEEAGMTMIDSEADLDQSMDMEVLPMSLNETGVPRLVVFTSQKTWEVSMDDLDSLSIGRTDENQVVIEHTKVSRHHAEVVRRGGIFLLRDLGSTNGTWHNNEKVAELILQDGDAFRIGEAQLVFKSGFSAEALTMADE